MISGLEYHQFISDKIERYLEKYTYGKYKNNLLSLRNSGKLFFLSELRNMFSGTDFFCLGTGGSVANIKNIERLKSKNLMVTTYAPYHLQKIYGISSNFWPISYAPVVDYVLQMENNSGFIMDLSDTYVLIPTHESNTKVNVYSPAIRRLMRKHPEATYVLFNRMEASILHGRVSPSFLQPGVEPILCFDDHTLHNLFVPILSFLGVKNIYFSGVDLIPETGHFWDRDVHYQSMNGKPLKFPENLKIKQGQEIVDQHIGSTEIYRLEPHETRLTNYPLISFEDALNVSGNRPEISILKETIKPFLFHKYF